MSAAARRTPDPADVKNAVLEHLRTAPAPQHRAAVESALRARGLLVDDLVEVLDGLVRAGRVQVVTVPRVAYRMRGE